MKPIQPGGRVGVVGGGQLGRMLAMEARRLGLRVRVLSEESEPCAAGAADACLFGDPSDPAALAAFARCCDVLTFEREDICTEALQAAEAIVPVRPSPALLASVQDRLLQRRLLDRLGLPQPAYAPVSGAEELEPALARLGRAGVLKRRRGGFDGRGQVRVRAGEEAVAWRALGGAPAVLEALVPWTAELAVVAARGAGGEVCVHPVVETLHQEGILRATRVPASVGQRCERRAVELARSLIESLGAELGYIGVLAVELFVLEDETLLVNEIAARVHNSGHYSLGGCVTSQFEQHLRAICGWPLGDPTLLRPAVMINLLGDLWERGSPDWAPVLREPGVNLHLYGKKAAPGRKVGHLLVLGERIGAAVAAGERVWRHLEPRAASSLAGAPERA